jgi:hypothetical protein
MDSKITEFRLQQDCFTWHWNTRPEERGRLFMVHNNPRNATDGARLKAIGMVAGVSDLVYLRVGLPPLCIELKVGDGAQSERQKWWEGVSRSVGCSYVVVRTLDEFKNVLGEAPY